MRTFPSCHTAIHKAILGAGLSCLSFGAVAGDLGILNDTMTASNAGGGFSQAVSIATPSTGIFGDINGVPTSGTLDFPTFSFTLEQSGVADGTYTFSGGVIIDDENSMRRLEVKIPTITMTFSGGVLSGSVNASQTVRVLGRSGDGSVQAQADVSSGGGASFTGSSLSFNADDAIAQIESGPTILADIINTIDTTTSGHYSYGLFLKQLTGPASIRFGSDPTGTFTSFPCTTGADFTLNGSELSGTYSGAYGLQGQLDFAGASSGYASTDPNLITSGACATYTPPSTGGGTGGGTGGDTGAPTTTDEAVDEASTETTTLESQISSGGITTTEAATTLVTLSSNTSSTANDLAAALENGTATPTQAVSLVTTLTQQMTLTETLFRNAEDSGASVEELQSLNGQLFPLFKQAYDSLTTVIAALGGSAEASLAQISTIRSQVGDSLAVTRFYLDRILTNSNFSPATAITQSTVVSDIEALISDDINPTINALLALTGVQMDAELATELQDISQTSVELVLSALGTQLGETISYVDAATTQALLANDATLLYNLANVVLINIDDAELDTDALSTALQDDGVAVTFAGNLAADLEGFVNPNEQVFDLGAGDFTLNTVLNDLIGAAVFSDSQTHVTSYTRLGTEHHIHVKRAAVAPESFPEGTFTTPTGSTLYVADGVVIEIVPASADIVEFAAAIQDAGNGTFSTRVTDNGVIQLLETATGISFNGTISDAGSLQLIAEGTVSFGAPSVSDPASTDYFFTVKYPDGNRQSIYPIVVDPAFYESVASYDFGITVDRSTGLIDIDGFQFRPSYFQVPATGEDLVFLSQFGDANGVAYRTVHANGDGIVDVEVITASGVQVVYGL